LDSVLGVTVDEHRSVHGSRGRSGDTLDAQPSLFQQAIDHTPGESAVRTAALQREVHKYRIAT
jgi:hypothetical protein